LLLLALFRLKYNNLQEVEALCDMLDFGGPAMVECAKLKSMPTISFTIAGREFMLAPEQYVLRVDAGMPSFCESSHCLA
jgi:phytepsin